MLKQLQGTIEEESGEASGSQLELIERLKGKQRKHTHTHSHTHVHNIMQHSLMIFQK